MRTTFTHSTSTPLNIYKQEFLETGVITSYSISITKADAERLALVALKRKLTVPTDVTHPLNISHICHMEVFNKEVTYKKVPYKQVHPVKYTRTFRFLKISIYVPYLQIFTMNDVYKICNTYIRWFLPPKE